MSGTGGKEDKGCDGKRRRRVDVVETEGRPERDGIFATPVPDACVHLCMAFMDTRSWFALQAVSHSARSWCARPAQLRVVRSTTLACVARRALAAELAALLELPSSEDAVRATAELCELLRETGAVWAGGSLAHGLCGGGVDATRVPFDAKVFAKPAEKTAWAGRDLDLFVPWSATLGGSRLCPVAAFFERRCAATRPVPPFGAPESLRKWWNVCRYMTSGEDRRSATLRDSDGVYFAEPAPDAPDQWSVSPVMDDPANPGRAVKREWRWCDFASTRYRVPFIRARRIYRCPASGRSIDIVYVDVAGANVALGALVPQHVPVRICKEARLERCPTPHPSPDGNAEPTFTYGVADWYTLACDLSVAANTYDGARLVTCADACLRRLSFRLAPSAEICALLPSWETDWAYHGSATYEVSDAGVTTAIRESRALRVTQRDRVQKYTRRGLTERPQI